MGFLHNIFEMKQITKILQYQHVENISVSILISIAFVVLVFRKLYFFGFYFVHLRVFLQ